MTKLWSIALIALGICCTQAFGEPRGSKLLPSYSDYIRSSAVSRASLDRWTQDTGWTKFDSRLGYVLGNSFMPWGINGSSTIETVQANGARTSLNYANKKPRINTYGDSFTESEQVSDAETWQEYLAGHLGEPVANFGVGGYGVYQAYLRMLREEGSAHGAKYVIMTICCDDSTRSLFRSRRTAFYRHWPEYGGIAFHGNFWSNIEIDLATGQFREQPQLLSTKSSLYKMTDPDWLSHAMSGDLAMQLALFARGETSGVNREGVTRLAQWLGFHIDWNADDQSLRYQAKELLNIYSQRASIYVIGKAKDYLDRRGKTLIVVLNGDTSIEQMQSRGTREDQALLDYIRKEKIPYVDMNEIFLERARKLNISPKEYVSQFLVNGIGHFNPSGNHFIAYSILETLSPLLDPKAVPNQNAGLQGRKFEGYLTGGIYDAIKSTRERRN